MSTRLRRLWVQITTDRRRFALLCSLTLVGLLLWSRIIVISQMPRSVIADDPSIASAMDSDSPDLRKSDNPTKVAVLVHLADIPDRDPFTINGHFLELSGQNANSLQEPRKSGALGAEDPERTVASFQLEAVMQRPAMAIINGMTLRIGDEVMGPTDSAYRFRLVSVSRRSAVLEWGGKNFELSMSGPGDRSTQLNE
ncbi:MAG: hypothetical protein P8J86_11655 [Phycisphaerales bacterium]|nr:hypothetical protein [Phycisphaerales bacterium]